MNDTEKLTQIRSVVQEWANKQGHDRCWYYPDLFRQIAAILELELPKTPVLPPRVEAVSSGHERVVVGTPRRMNCKRLNTVTVP